MPKKKDKCYIYILWITKSYNALIVHTELHSNFKKLLQDVLQVNIFLGYFIIYFCLTLIWVVFLGVCFEVGGEGGKIISPVKGSLELC